MSRPGTPQRLQTSLRCRTAAQTNIFFFDANGQQVLHLDLEVTLDSKAVKKLIDRTLPGNNIQVDTTGNNVVLKGTAANAVESRTAEELAAKAVGPEASIVNTLKIVATGVRMSATAGKMCATGRKTSVIARKTGATGGKTCANVSAKRSASRRSPDSFASKSAQVHCSRTGALWCNAAAS